MPACAMFTMPQSGLMAHKLQGKLKDKLLDVRSACIWAMIDFSYLMVKQVTKLTVLF